MGGAPVADVTTRTYIRVRRRAPHKWIVDCQWGTIWCLTWTEAMAEADRLRRVIHLALKREEERSRQDTAPCSYQSCGKPGRHIKGWGRGFAFCAEHAPVAEHYIDNPRPLRNRRAPQIHSLKEHAA